VPSVFECSSTISRALRSAGSAKGDFCKATPLVGESSLTHIVREPRARVSYEVNLVDADAGWVRLTYAVNGHSVDYVRLVSTLPSYGGRPWWFLCPLERKDGRASRRVAQLYLPPGGKYFGSRQAHGLTYKSCQESGKYDGLFRRIGAKFGMDVRAVRRALKEI
jgi:hypothetical protein